MLLENGNQKSKMSRINIIKINKNVLSPIKKTKYATCYDVYSAETITIQAGDIVAVRLGIVLDMPEDLRCDVRPRSGLTCKGIICILGTIDADYKEEVRAIVLNTTQQSYTIETNTRIAQLFFSKDDKSIEVCIDGKAIQVDNTIRSGGFGSTGYK